MDLVTSLKAWDGKTVASLVEIEGGLTEGDHDALLNACRSREIDVARAASWVLKAAYQKGAEIPFPTDVLSSDPHWEVVLHLLQSIQHVPVELPTAIVRPHLDHPKPLIRAWSLDALFRLGAQDIDDLLNHATADPAASVRARVRNLRAMRR